MTEHNRRKEDENRGVKWLYTIIGGVLVVVLSGWLITTSAEVKTTSTNVAVLQTQYAQVKCDLSEIKEMVKTNNATVNDIRNDQIRRENRENGKK